MKNVLKTAVAAALLVGAGAANASIANGIAASELFLQVYDSSRGLTYDLDLGKSNTVVLSNPSAIISNFNYDLSADANWQTFLTGMNAATTKWGVVAGYATNLIYSSNATPIVSSNASLGQITTAVKNQAAQVNTGLVGTSTALDVSRLVLDSDTAKTGQWAAAAAGANPLTTLYGTFSAADAAIAFGGTGNLMYNYFDLSTKSLASTTLGQITLDASHLGVAAVPVPGAVWMFGSALLGLMGVGRRKAVAA